MIFQPGSPAFLRMRHPAMISKIYSMTPKTAKAPNNPPTAAAWAVVNVVFIRSFLLIIGTIIAYFRKKRYLLWLFCGWFLVAGLV